MRKNWGTILLNLWNRPKLQNAQHLHSGKSSVKTEQREKNKTPKGINNNNNNKECGWILLILTTTAQHFLTHTWENFIKQENFRSKPKSHLRLFREKLEDPVACDPLKFLVGESIDPLKEVYAALAGSGTKSNGIDSTKHAVLMRVLSSSVWSKSELHCWARA